MYCSAAQPMSRDMNMMSSPLFSPSTTSTLTTLFLQQEQQEMAVKSEAVTSWDYYQEQSSGGVLRYRSAPTSFFAGLLDTCNDEDYFTHQQPGKIAQSETESVFATPPTPPVLCNDSSNSDSNVILSGSNPMLINRSPQQSDGYTANCANNLIRQSSFPAEFFSGYSTSKAGNGMYGETNSSTSRLNNMNISFSSGSSSCSRFMPSISENVNESIGEGSPENRQLRKGNNANGSYVTRFSNESWSDSTFTSSKRKRDCDFSNPMESENRSSRNYSPGLTHHLSLPKTSAEMADIEKILHFQQDSEPCKLRARRGFATHPRSIAERVRRTRISERIRKLQELVPRMDKQTNTADMLDLAVDYIKELQNQVQTLEDTQAKCTCSTKQK